MLTVSNFSEKMSGTRGLITLGKKLVSNSGPRRTCSPSSHLQRQPNTSQNSPHHSSSSFSTVSSNKKTPTAKHPSTDEGSRNVTTLANGGILDEPFRYQRFGLLKVILTMGAGLSIGALISKNFAAFLEENELFVPEDDDDDDDDDDD